MQRHVKIAIENEEKEEEKKNKKKKKKKKELVLSYYCFMLGDY
jgi:hypothetical protein